MKYSSILLLLSFLTACGEKGFNLGSMTSKDLKQQMGEPSQVQSGKNGKQVYIYPDDKKFQIDGEVVEASFRKPTAEEEHLIYWRHHFKKEKTTLRRLPVPEDSHLMALQELSCPSMGQTVIYDPNIDKVVRVISYEKRK